MVLWMQEILLVQMEEVCSEAPFQQIDISEHQNVPVVGITALYRPLKDTSVIVVGEIAFAQNVPLLQNGNV